MKTFQPAGIPPAYSTHSRASTATYVDDAGLLQTAAANVLRYQGGLPLVEAAGTNLFRYSGDMSNAAWIKNNAAAAVYAGLGPNGVSGSAYRVYSGSLGNDFIQQAPVADVGTPLVASFLIKNDDALASHFMVRSSITTATFFITWAGANIASMTGGSCGWIPLANGWFRVWFAYTSGEVNQYVRVYPDTSNAGRAVYLWGADVKLGTDLSSHIPTTTAAVTRAADVFTPSATDLIGGTGPAGGVFFTTATAYYGAWFATSYSPGGTRVVHQGSLWELAADQSPAAAGDVPGVSPKWLLVGPENRLAAFDGEINSRSYSHPLPNLRTNSVTFIVSLGAAADALLISDIADAASVRVRIAASLTGATLVDQTITPAAGASRVLSQYLITGFTAPDTAVLFISFSGPVNVATPGVGLIAWGQTQDSGCVQWGARAGIKDYSRKEPDDFGQVIFVRRAFAKTVSATVSVEKADINTVHDRLANLRATPVVWIFSDDQDYSVPLVVYGFFKDFYTTFPRLNDIQCALEIEGLT